jgi:hypothetical protein
MRTILALIACSAVVRAQDVALSAAPSVLAPGVISTPGEEFKATESPDHLTLLYVLTDHQFRHMTIVESHRRSPAAAWETPDVAAFSGIYRDGDPAFTPDGKRVLFISNRGAKVFRIWSVPRKADGHWGEPTLLVPSDTDYLFAPSMTSTGVLYFSRGDSIYRVAKPGDRPETLPFAGGDPAVTADERYVVFDNNGDLYMSCRTTTGWMAPRRFAEPVNSPDDEGDPWVTADGRTMYFYSRRATPAPDRAPRAQRPTYADVLREVTSDIYNGTRNLYTVDVSSLTC